MFDEFGGWRGWGHPQLTAGQQAARRAVAAAQEGIDAQWQAWRSQMEAAAIAGSTTMPSQPSALSTAYQALVTAEGQSKAADTAAAAPPAIAGATSP